MFYTKNVEINSILKGKYLSSKELVEVIKKYKRARLERRKVELNDKIFSNVARFIQKISIAQFYKHGRLGEFEDVFQCGVMGYCKALEKFKPKLGFAFTTYMKWWVDKYIQDYYYASRLIYTPKNVIIDSVKIDKCTQKYFSKKRKIELSEFLEKEFKGKRKFKHFDKADKLFKNTKSMTSLDKPLSMGENDTNLTYGDIIRDAEDYEKGAEVSLDLSVALKMMDRVLSEKESSVMKMRYLGGNGEMVPLKRVGRNLNMTYESVRKAESRAIKKLRYAADK